MQSGGDSGTPARTYKFDAFISYAHGADDLIATALQTRLNAFAKPWYRLRSIRTFRDDSNLAANAVPLLGVTALPAGKSAVFFEDTGGLDDATITAAFAQAWFGKSTLPAGFLIGHYGGSGVGLSTSGDAVNLFDGSGNPITGVTFGASPSAAPFATFDNTAGTGSNTPPAFNPEST